MKHILMSHEIVKTDFVRGQNCDLYDAQGKGYIDFEAGCWSAALGHNHPQINQTIQAQVNRVTHLGTNYPNLIAEEAATALLDIVSMPEGKCVFLSSGSEAVEFGVQIMRRITEKPLLLALSGSYMAAYGSAGKKNPTEWYFFDWTVCTDCPHQEECNLNCDHLKEIPFDQIGGFVFEVGNNAGFKFLPTHFVQALTSSIKQQQGLVMANEITSGMGRTGAWFGFQHYQLQPDIISVGKGLGNGYPVSAVLMKQQLAEKLENNAFRYVQSHQNDPLGCAIAKKVVAVMQTEQLIDRSDRIGTQFLVRLKRLAEQQDAIKDARGKGLMLIVELTDNAGRFSATSVTRELFDRGFLVGCNPTANLLRFYPSLTIEEDRIGQLVDNLQQVVLGRLEC